MKSAFWKISVPSSLYHNVLIKEAVIWDTGRLEC